MALSDQDIIFASLMGSKSAKTIERLNIVEKEIEKHVLPEALKLLKPLFKNKEEDIEDKEGKIKFETNKADVPVADQFFPLSFSLTERGEKWKFPYEPMINISTGNNIIKREIAKQGDKLIGTIKERWSRKDYEIQVTGVLIGPLLSGTVQDCFPKDDMQSLFEFLKYQGAIYVNSPPLEILGINKVVVEDYSFPFTNGENVQAFEIKLVSDYAYELLIEEKN